MKQIVADIAEIAGLVASRGWSERNAGNISVDVTEACLHNEADFGSEKVKTTRTYPELAGRCFLVTASGSRFRDIAKRPEEHLFLARIADEADGYQISSLPGGAGRPLTSEFPSHTGIHSLLRRRDPAKKVVLHTHPDHLLALTHIDQYSSTETLTHILWSMHPEMRIVMPDGVGLVPYCLPGSEALADATTEVLREHRVALWEKHGCLAVGKDVFEAYDLIDTAEKSAKIFLMVKSAGFEAQGLSQAQLDELLTFG